jgi:ketosteroid isomerase-like protein
MPERQTSAASRALPPAGYWRAMSQANVEIVRSGFRAFNERNFDAVLANFADDVEWRLIGGFADLMGAEFKGHEAMRRFLNDWDEYLGGEAEIETVLEANDRVVVIVRSVAAGGRSGAPAAMRWGQVYRFRHGQISAVDNYYVASEALEAVGLSEQDAHTHSS